MNESKIEKYVRTRVPGYLLKWVSPGESGVPDRILVTQKGLVLIEFKDVGGVLSPRQKLWINRFKVLGIEVRVIEGMEEARRFVNEIQSACLSTEDD